MTLVIKSFSFCIFIFDLGGECLQDILLILTHLDAPVATFCARLRAGFLRVEMILTRRAPQHFAPFGDAHLLDYRLWGFHLWHDRKSNIKYQKLNCDSRY